MRTIALAVFVCCLVTMAHAAGLRLAEVPASVTGPALKAVIWTPCDGPAPQIVMGPYIVNGRRDCPRPDGKRALVVISHGHGGSFLGHHDLAETLADAGFVVAAINHPGDTVTDMSRASDLSAFVERPTDISRLIDYMLGSDQHAEIDPARIGFFGFSRGGYTGLVLAGGNPDFLHADIPCPDAHLPICMAIRRNDVPTAPLTHDARIKAFVLADPLDAFPTSQSLKDVTTPIQLWTSEFGGDGVRPETATALASALPRSPELHRVLGAAHFAFLAPCSERLSDDAPAICVDAAGFDRSAFHRSMNAEVLSFFRSRLLE